MAAKRTHELIPMCHPLLLTGIEVSFAPDEAASTLHITATVRTFGKTGVEMEALTAVSAAALTVYDMVKAVDRGMTITAIRLAEKHGGKSGDFVHPDEPALDAIPGRDCLAPWRRITPILTVARQRAVIDHSREEAWRHGHRKHRISSR